MSEFFNCGCGGDSDIDWEEIIRRINEEAGEEEELIPVVIPVTPERIPAEDWPVRKREDVEVDR